MKRPTRALSLGGSIALVTSILTMTLTVACPWLSGPPGPKAPTGGRPECPGDGARLPVYKDTIQPPVVDHFLGTLPLSEPITDIPEFHDCQRFVVAGASDTSYDSLYAIFASYRLNSLMTDLDSFPRTIRSGREFHIVSKGTSRVSVPVATVWTDGAYGPLGIKRGYNCVFLYRDATPSGWGAKMVPLAIPDTNCLGEFDPNASGLVLEVKSQQTSTAYSFQDYPAVARWDWDSVGSVQYLGIKCGAAWCEVGPPGFHPSAPYGGPLGTFHPVSTILLSGQQQQRVTNIKGWYDAQVLDNVVNGTQVPGHVHGVIIPSPWSEFLPSDLPPFSASVLPAGYKVFKDTWVHMANVYLDGDYKWNLSQGVNQIWVCLEVGATGGCGVPLNQPPLWPPWHRALNSCDKDDDINTVVWWAKIVRADGKPMFRCVKRRGHGQKLVAWNTTAAAADVFAAIPGTARWRWILDDAGEWSKCETGCCTGH